MAFEQYKISLEFTVDRDSVPGWGHQSEDWVKYVTDRLAGSNNHYNPSVEIKGVETHDKPGT